MKPRTTHEEFCLKNAAHFVAARGRTLTQRLKRDIDHGEVPLDTRTNARRAPIMKAATLPR